jgi:inorganic phosphate transporter, PiT family
MATETILIAAVLIVGFYMAWNIGANDVSNAMGTSVGSGALTLTKAIIIAGLLEFAGAFLLGANVSETMQRGIVNPDFFAHNPRILLYGMISALLGTAIWLQVASYFGWPVSTTHAIVGALIGFGAIVGGPHTVHWSIVGSIALSWVISPALSGVFAYLIFTVLQRRILFARNPIGASKRIIPLLLGLLFFVFMISSVFGGLKNFSFNMNRYVSLALAVGVGILAMIAGYIWMWKARLPRGLPMKLPLHLLQMASLDKTLKHLQRLKLGFQGSRKDEVGLILKDVRALSKSIKEENNTQKRQSDYQIVEKLFGVLQIFSAAYVAFAHGANDVANAIGPVAASLELIRDGALSAHTQIPVWLLVLGGSGIVVGLATWGWRVIQTIGKKITELTPTRGFSAEFGAAITILVASKLGLPISTTHCIVGAVLGVGLARGISAINLRTLRDIVLSWIITIPASALVAIIIFYILKATLPP